MSPFDISVMIFFIVMVVKVITDTFEFWREFDEQATVTKPDMAPRHLPAPSRPSPKVIKPVAHLTTMPARMEPIKQPVRRTVRRPEVAMAERTIRPVSAPIKRTASNNRKTVA